MPGMSDARALRIMSLGRELWFLLAFIKDLVIDDHESAAGDGSGQCASTQCSEIDIGFDAHPFNVAGKRALQVFNNSGNRGEIWNYGNLCNIGGRQVFTLRRRGEC
jgi:hypothetical protein